MMGEVFVNGGKSVDKFMCIKIMSAIGMFLIIHIHILLGLAMSSK